MTQPTEKINKVILCYHCGNKTLMENVTSHKYSWSDDEEVEIFSEWYGYNGKLEPEVTLLYPQISSNARMPKNVRKAFDAAKKVRNIDGAICALSLRRTLEMMCKDKGATKGDLFKKLKYLSEQGILPPILDKMASVLRHLGNSAAHADSADFPMLWLRIWLSLLRRYWITYIYYRRNLMKFRER